MYDRRQIFSILAAPLAFFDLKIGGFTLHDEWSSVEQKEDRPAIRVEH